MNKRSNLKKNILDKINKGNLKMKPRSYFVFKALLISIVVVITVITLSFLVSFAVFSIKESSRLFLLGFGSVGIQTFLLTFPWFLLIIEIILLIAVDILLKYFRFAYKTPFIYLMFGTAVFAVFVSIFISATPIHETLYQEAVEQKFPIFENIYLNVKRPPAEEGVFRGVVTSIDDDMFTIYSDDRDEDKDDGYNVVFIPKDKSEYILSKLKIGDRVLTACKQGKDERCYLYGLKNLEQ